MEDYVPCNVTPPSPPYFTKYTEKKIKPTSVFCH